MAALKSGVKSGTAKHKDSGCPEGMLQALVAMANFCDQELRMKEDEGMQRKYSTSILKKKFIFLQRKILCWMTV